MLNILVVEDEEAVATELVDGFDLLGHRAEWAHPQRVGASIGTYDLVLLDLDLGMVDGFHWLEELGALPMSPAVAVMTGHANRMLDAAADYALAHGLRLVARLTKPFGLAALRDVTESAIGDGAVRAAIGAAPLPGAEAHYVFQYKNDVTSGAPVGCEVLLRLPGVSDIEGWFRRLDPGIAFAMTLSAADAAIDLRRRLERRGEAMPVAFNCPPDVFCRPDFLLRLKERCSSARVAPVNIGVELTEQGGETSAVDIGAVVCRYALAGFPVLLDDFGAGAASLEQLVRLPVAEMKIDRRLFRSLAQKGRGLLYELISFCRSHQIASTIEGIETAEELAIIRSSGADFGQGFFWSRPSPILGMQVSS